MLKVGVEFTTDEAEFLSAVLTRGAEGAPAGSAERFWLERLHSRVQQAVVDVVAADAEARLAASAVPQGFGFPPPAPPPPIPQAVPPPPAGSPFPAPGNCSCGYVKNSAGCVLTKKQGKHP